MDEFEKLGAFYLGKEFDLKEKKIKESLLLYDSKDLVTHAVCVGMTGSGKTGLCVSLLEEAAIDGIPSIIVDPKGDLSNLLLTFPDLNASQFKPWINEADARKKNLTPKEYAGRQAELWKKGLAQWGQDSSRIRRLREAADFKIYTPGSSAGIPVSILQSFQPPDTAVIQDSDLFRERINSTVTSLLNLLGIDADPIQSREHILLSTILDISWKQGENMELANFIQAIQSPPINKIGVFDLESFFPSKDRFSLAMKLNNLLAAPGFQNWLEGEPLAINNILYTEQGKPKVSIFSIAHLNDTERMFFVSLLITQVLGWMRTQSGTTSLRALFYMDEIFGYFPPVSNPPSKAPLLTLLKQARAFGLGVVLATQNPVDLDYKGLSNTGTWFIGRLQTDRDKQRVLDGLEGAESSSGGRFNRQEMERILAGLGKRVFLMNNVHEDAPVIFQTRWVMSYLRGPLARNQIKKLMDPVKKDLLRSAGETPVQAAPITTLTKQKISYAQSKPMLPPGVPQFYIPVHSAQTEGTHLFYEPALLGIGKVYFSHAKSGITAEREFSLLADFAIRGMGIDWSEAQSLDMSENDVERFPDDEADYGEISEQAGQKKNYAQWSREYRNWLYRNASVELFKSPSLSIVSAPGESERDFRVRLQLAAREQRDVLLEKISKKYVSKIDKMQERIHRAEQNIEKEKEQAKQEKFKTAISFGATIFSALLGRKRVSRSSMGRAATTARQAGRILKEGKDIERAEDTLSELHKKLSDLEAGLAEETERIKSEVDPLNEKLETIILKPKKTDVSVTLVALAWVPYWQNKNGGIKRA